MVQYVAAAAPTRAVPPLPPPAAPPPQYVAAAAPTRAVPPVVMPMPQEEDKEKKEEEQQQEEGGEAVVGLGIGVEQRAQGEVVVSKITPGYAADAGAAAAKLEGNPDHALCCGDILLAGPYPPLPPRPARTLTQPPDPLY